MSMLEKLCDVRNTFEGKALAIFMAAVLAFSFINISAFADASDDSSTEPPAEQTEPASTDADTSAPSEAPEPTATEPSATTETQTPVEPSAQNGATVPPTTGTETDLPTAEPGVAVVGLDFSHAYVKYLDQTVALPTASLNVPLNKELVFFAYADEGYELDTVKTVIGGVETELTADEQTGEYKVPADQVTSNLTLKVEGAEKAAESPEGDGDNHESQPFSKDEGESAAPEAEAFALTNYALHTSAMDSVAVGVEFVNDQGKVVKTDTAVLPAGVLADNAPSYEGYSYKYALVDNNPIIYAGTRDGAIYYTAEGSLDSGIAMKLEGGKSIKLVYEPFAQKHAVTYEVQGDDGQAGNTHDGPASVRDGEDLSFRVDAAYGYTVSVTCDGAAVPSQDYIYTLAGVADDVTVAIAYTKNTTFKFTVEDRGSVNWHGAYFDRDATYSVPADGETFTFKTRSPEPGWDFDYRLNALTINGETIDIPAVNPGSLGSDYSPWKPPVPTATTVLSNGVEVTVTLVKIINYSQYEYDITLKGVKDDITVTPGNYRASNWQEVMPRYTSGVVLEYSFDPSYSADEVAARGTFKTAKNYLPIATADDGAGQMSPWFRAKLMDGYENLGALLDGGSVLRDPSTKEIDGWLYFRVYALNGGSQNPNNLRNLSVTADLVEYSVAYDTNGGSAAPTDGASYDYVSNTQLMVAGTVPTKEGNLFLGWGLNGSSETYIPGQVLDIADVSAYAGADNTLTFTAQWTGSAAVGTPVPVQVNYYYMQDDGQYPETPDKVSSVRGYTGAWIEKWNAADEAPQDMSFDEARSTTGALVSGNPANPTILKLYYSAAKKYTVTYDLAGGTTESPATTFTGIDEGAATPTIADPTREGYAFLGWDKKIAPTVTENATYTAQWERIPVEYTYAAQEGGVVSLASESVDPETGVAAGSTATAEKGYQLVGWYTADGKAITSINAASFNVKLDNQMRTIVPIKNADGVYTGGSFVAHFQEIVVTLEYKVADGQRGSGNVYGADDVPHFLMRERINAVAGEPTGATAIAAKGYVFDRWTSTLSGGKAVSTDPLLTREVIDAVAKNSGVYASGQFVAHFKESEDVTIGYVADKGGAVDRAVDVVAPATGAITDPTTATPDYGYHFVNWTTEVNGEVVEVSTSATLAPDVVDSFAKDADGIYQPTVFTAHFAEDAVAITYEADEGGTVSPDRNDITTWSTAVAGSAATPSDHYYFVGWSVKGSDAIISTDTTIDTSVVEQYAKDDRGAFKDTRFVAHFAAKQKLTITADSGEYFYNGAARVVDGMTYAVEGGSKELTLSGVTVHGEATDASDAPYPVTFSNEDGLVITDAAGTDVTKRYEPTFVDGTLIINPRPIEVTGDGWSEPQQYTGTAYSKDTYTVEGSDKADERGLVRDHRATASYNISGTAPGDYTGTPTSIVIVDAAGTDVTANYKITPNPGKLTVVPSDQLLVITAATNSWMYDGREYTDGSYTVKFGDVEAVANDDGTYTLPTGDKVTATVYGSVTHVADGAEGNNKVTGFTVDNQGYYKNVASVNGTLSITPRPVTLTSASETKEYDGTPLTANRVEVSGNGFVSGEGASYEVTGSQTAVGFADNKFTYALNEGTAADDYVITPEYGTLTVTNRAEGAKFDITVEANSGEFTYNGSEWNVSGLKQTEFVFGGVTFTVTGLDASASKTNAGTYDVTVSGTPVVTDENGNIVTGEFIINRTNGKLVIKKRPLTLESATLSKVYDGTPLTNGTTPLATEDGWAEGEGATYEFTNSVSQPGETKPNEFTVKPNDGTSLDNYAVSPKPGQLTIENRPEGIKYTVTVTANSLSDTYDGTEKSVSGFVGGTDQGVPVQADGRTYYVRGLTAHAAGTDVADSAVVPVEGVAQVFDENNNEVSSEFKVTPVPGSLTIGKRTVTLASKNLSKEYDGTPLTNGENGLETQEGWVEGQGAAYEFTGSVTLPGAEYPNAFEIVPNEGTNLDNYKVDKVEGTLRIMNREAQYEVTLTANSFSDNYDGTAKSVSGFVGEENGAVPVQVGGQTYYVSGLTSSASGTNAGTYHTAIAGTAVVMDAENHDVSAQFNVNTEKGALVVDKRPITLQSASGGKFYDGTPLENHTVDMTDGSWAADEGATYAFSASALLPGDIVTNAFEIVPNEGTNLENYKVQKIEGQLIVKNRDAKYEVTVTANSLSDTYDGTEKSVSGFVGGTDQGVPVQADGRTYYVRGLTSAASGTNVLDSVSSIPVNGKVEVFDEHNNKVSDQFNVTPVSGSLTIDKRPLALTSATLSKVYDGTPLENGATALDVEQGWAVVNGASEGATYQFTGSVTLPGDMAPNAFEIFPNSGTDLANYAITKSEGQLTIENRSEDAKYAIDLEANSGTFLYDGQEKSVDGFVQTEFTFGGVTYTVTGVTASATRTDAGTMKVGITGKPVVLDANDRDVTDQFKVTPVQGTLTVNKRAVTLQSAQDEKTYDGTPLTNHNVAVSGDGWAAGEGAAYNVTGSQTVVGFSDNAFTYELTGATNVENYTITKIEGRLTVKSRDAKYEVTVTANSGTFTYDGTEKSVSGFVGETDQGIPVQVGDQTYYVTGLTASAELTDAGAVEVKAKGTPVVRDAEGNVVTGEFNVKPVDGALTVDQRKVIITSASATKEYDGEALVAHDVIVSGDGWAAGEGASYDYTGSQTTVGMTPNHFTATLNENTKASNYDVKLIKGELTVTSRNAAFNVVVKAASDTVLYDGTEHSVAGFENETSQGIPVQAGGNTYYVTGLSASVSGTDADTYVVSAVGTPVVLDAMSNDVSSQFSVTPEPGKLVVNKRHVVLQSASDTKPYDGTPLTNHNVAVSGDGWAEGEGADYVFTGSQMLVGTSDNTFDYVLKNGAKAENYQIDPRYGSLTVTNRGALYAVTVTANSATVTYDGTEQSVSGLLNQTDQGVAVQADGRTYYVTGLAASASGTDADTYEATVTGTPVVRDAENNDVSSQFAVTPQAGSLVIEKRALTLESANLSKKYDGRPLTNGSEPLAVEDGWAPSEGASYVFTGSVMLPGETAANAFVIKANDGTSLDNYVVSKAEGQLSVENRDARYDATVTGQSGTFTYDGTEHAVNGFVGQTGQGVPIQIDGQTYYVTGLTAQASGTNVADSVGAIPVEGVAVVKDADGNDVSDQFNIKVEAGSLTIDPAELVIAANDTGKRYGDGDPALTASVSGLVAGDTFTGSYVVTRAPGENAGTYEITVSDVQLGALSNYTATTTPGSFIIAPAGEVTFIVNDASKPYDGTPLVPSGFNPIGLAPGDTVEVVYGGSQTDAGTSEGTITDYVIRNAAGEDVTANYPNIVIAPGELRVTLAAAIITVNNAAKVAGAVDPDFAGTVTGLVAEGDLGDIAYSRTNADEAAGVYADVLTATFTANPNYTVTVVPGTFTITAAPVTPPAPTTPTTPTPATPTPAPATPVGTVPEGPLAPILAPVVEVLEDAVTPLAGPQEETIEDDGTPLAGFDRVNCWVHYYLILGIIVTVIYGAGVLVRRINFTRKLKGFEDDVLGIEDESAVAPVAAPMATEGKEA